VTANRRQFVIWAFNGLRHQATGCPLRVRSGRAQSERDIVHIGRNATSWRL